MVAEIQNKTYSFFIVDADPNDQHLLETTIKQLMPGSTIMLFEDGLELLEHLIQYEERPDLIFLDMILKKSEGKATLKLISQDRSLYSLPVVALSRNTSTAEKDDIPHPGAIASFAKPLCSFGLEQIVSKVKHDFLDGRPRLC